MKRWFIIALSMLTLTAGGGYYYYSQVYLPAQAAATATTPQLQTATVRRGDITLTASGVGNLVPAAQLDLGFRTSGQLLELNVQVGAVVTAGQVLARLDDTVLQIQVVQAQLNLAEAKRSLAELTSASAIAEAELAVVNAQDAVNTAQNSLTALKQPDVDYYADAVATAQKNYDLALANQELVSVGSRSQAQTVASAQTAVDNAYTTWQHYTIWYGEGSDRAKNAKTAYDLAMQDLKAAQINLTVASTNQSTAVNTALTALTTAQNNYAAARNYQPNTQALALAQATLHKAQADLSVAQAHLAELNSEPLPTGAVSTLAAAQAKVTEAQLALDTAKTNLENTVLTAPFAGTVMSVDAIVGQSVGSTAILTLADISRPLVQFYIDEADLGSVAPGYPVNVVFAAAPDVTFAGTVTRVDPALVSVSNSSVVQAWAELTPNATVVKQLVGMNADVDVVAGAAQGALLVPIQALRELAPGSYAVFVVQADGKLKLTPVTVGLKDFANAEILAGLNQGDVVTTGTTETQP